MTQNNYPEGLDELAEELDAKFKPQWASDAARALLDALAERGYVLVDAKKQEPVAYMFEFPDNRVAPKFDTAPHGGKWKALYTRPYVAAPAGVPDFEPDAKRLALELECLLLECKDMAAVSKWWDSAHEALEQHRSMLSAAPTPPTQPQRDGSLRRDAQWINPNDKTQARYLPYIGELVLFCHGGLTYYGEHTGGSFRTGRGATARNFNTWECFWMYPPAAMEAING